MRRLMVATLLLLGAGEIPSELLPFITTLQRMKQDLRPAVVLVETRFPARMRGLRAGTATLGEYGTGMIWNGDEGLILTSAALLHDAQAIRVQTVDGKSYRAELVGKDERTDVALLRIPAASLTEVRFQPIGEARIGEPLLLVGFAEAKEIGFSFGILSAKPTAVNWAMGGVPSLLVFHGTASYGAFGAPIFNFRGMVLGMLTPRQERGQLYIHYAIPSDTVLRVARDLLKYGRFRRPWIGIRLLPPDLPVLEETGFPYNYGLYVVVVQPGSPAEKADLRVGDFLLELNGQPLRRTLDFWLPVNAMQVGDTLELTVWRRGAILQRRLQIAEYPREVK